VYDEPGCVALLAFFALVKSATYTFQRLWKRTTPAASTNISFSINSLQRKKDSVQCRPSKADSPLVLLLPFRGRGRTADWYEEASRASDWNDSGPRQLFYVLLAFASRECRRLSSSEVPASPLDQTPMQNHRFVRVPPCSHEFFSGGILVV